MWYNAVNRITEKNRGAITKSSAGEAAETDDPAAKGVVAEASVCGGTVAGRRGNTLPTVANAECYDLLVPYITGLYGMCGRAFRPIFFVFDVNI